MTKANCTKWANGIYAQAPSSWARFKALLSILSLKEIIRCRSLFSRSSTKQAFQLQFTSCQHNHMVIGNFPSDHVGTATSSEYNTFGNFSSGHLDMATSTSSHHAATSDHFNSNLIIQNWWKLLERPCWKGHLFCIQNHWKLLKWPFGHGHFNFKSLCHHDWPLHFCRYACTGTYISSSPTTFLAFVRVWIWQVWVEMNEKWLKLGQATGCNKWWWLNDFWAGSMVGKIVWIYAEEMKRSW